MKKSINPIIAVIATFVALILVFTVPVSAIADTDPVVPPIVGGSDGATADPIPSTPSSIPVVIGGSDGATADPTPSIPSSVPPVIPGQGQTDPSINTPATPPSSDTTGGTSFSSGGSGSFSSGGGNIYVPLATTSVAMIGTTTLTCPYLTSYITSSSTNDYVDIIKLQTFLKIFGNSPSLAITGAFDQATLNAVKTFQTLYTPDVLIPWGSTAHATGQVYVTTLRKINEIACNETLPLTVADMTIIQDYHNALAAENTISTTTSAGSTIPLVGELNPATSSNPSNNSALMANTNVTTSGLSTFGHFLGGIFEAIGHFLSRK
jgi:hypothetical protein